VKPAGGPHPFWPMIRLVVCALMGFGCVGLVAGLALGVAPQGSRPGPGRALRGRRADGLEK